MSSGRSSYHIKWSFARLNTEEVLSNRATFLFRNEGRFQKVPIISGIIKLEFVQYAITTLNDTERRERMENNWDTLAPICFQYERETERSKKISQTLRKTFLDFPLTDKRALEGLNVLYADGLIIFSELRFIRLASRHTPVYEYMNTYVGNRSHTYYPDAKTPYGPVHHDDLLYLLTGRGAVPDFDFDTLDSKQVTKATGLWAAFVQNGNPNEGIGKDILMGVEWKRRTTDRDYYLEIGKEFQMRENLFNERFEVWDKLFPLTGRLNFRVETTCNEE